VGYPPPLYETLRLIGVATHVLLRGVVRRRWKPLSADVSCDVELALDVNHVTVSNNQKSGISITDEMVLRHTHLNSCAYTP